MKKGYRKLCALLLPMLGVAACDPISGPDMYGPPTDNMLMYGPAPSYSAQPNAEAPAPEAVLDVDEEIKNDKEVG